MKRRAYIIVILSLFHSIGLSVNRYAVPGEVRVPFVELLIKANELDGKRVRVIGALYIPPTGSDEYLFPNKESAIIGDFASAVLLSKKDRSAVIDPAWSHEYVELVGTVLYEQKTGSVTIYKISSVMILGKSKKSQ